MVMIIDISDRLLKKTIETLRGTSEAMEEEDFDAWSDRLDDYVTSSTLDSLANILEQNLIDQYPETYATKPL